MSRKLLRAYRFATKAQWSACLFAGADREAYDGLRPFAPHAGPPSRFETKGGYAPTLTCVGDVLWRDGENRLRRLSYGDHRPHAYTAPFAIAHATRLIATSSSLWAASPDGASLEVFDLDSLARRLVVEHSDSRIVDFSGDGHDGVFALAERSGTWEIVRHDCAGRVKARFGLEGVTDPSAIIYLERADRLVVLAAGGSKLHWFAPLGGPPVLDMPINAVRPCFQVTVLGSDGRGRLFLAGTDGVPFGGLHQVVTLDADANLLGHTGIDQAPTGVTGNRTQLLVTTAGGLLRFETRAAISSDAPDVSAFAITPMLRSPTTDDVRRWLRVDATVQLPAGCTLEISYASTGDREVRDTALRIAADLSLPVRHRILRLHAHVAPWRTIAFHGGSAPVADDTVPLSAPLFDVREEYLWVAVKVIACSGAGLPALSQLAVLYPGVSLMENIPALYQRQESQSGSFLRSLVGVLESTTQTLDARISALGRNIHPQTAPAPWLDFIARWLDLPWDDALSLEQKRRIVVRAGHIAKLRGTRAGLEVLLECLLPGKPPRFRVVDAAADFSLAIVGSSDGRHGSRLPVVLGGLPSTATELGNKAILGRARLPCTEDDGGGVRLAGHVRVDVGATAQERERWGALLGAFIDSMVPATTRVELRWLAAAAFQRMHPDEGLELGADPAPHLGTDTVTGAARLPSRHGVTLPHSGADTNSALH